MTEALSWVCVVNADLTCVPRLLPCTTGVQPHPAPEPNQTDLSQVRLLKPVINHTHSTYVYLFFCNSHSRGTNPTTDKAVIL